MELVVAKLLQYSLEEVQWTFAKLTPREKEIVGNQANLDSIRARAEASISGAIRLVRTTREEGFVEAEDEESALQEAENGNVKWHPFETEIELG